MPTSDLAGLRVAFAALEGFPNRKGSGVRITHTVTALAARGAEVTLLTLRGDDRPHGLPPGVRHRPLGILDDNYLSRALAFRDQVQRALYAERPDVVHVRGPFEGHAALAYARARNKAFVFEVNGLPSVELRYHHPRAGTDPAFLRKLRADEEALLRGADHLLTQSRATARFLRLRAKAALPITVIPNGADPELFAPGPRPESTAVRLLYAGSLAPWQGLMDLLTSLRGAVKHAELELEVVGPARRAWQRAILQSARRLKLQDRVTVTDATDPATLAERVRATDVCVAPLARDTRNRIQGCSPIKLFEYMAAGRAVLASDLPCVREIITPDVTGALHKPSNPHRLRDALLQLAADPVRREALGRRARRYVLDQATWTHRHEAVAAAYARLLEAPARAAS